jgi:hypothetical protein
MDQATTRAPRWGRRLLLPAALGLTFLLGLSACGGEAPKDAVATLDGDGTDQNASNDSDKKEMTEEEQQQAMLDYARCMREHGIDMPDPTFDENGRGAVAISGVGGSDGPNEATMKAAEDACQPIMQDVIDNAPEQDPEEVAKRQQEALDFAKCMRDHGVDFPDPVFEDGGRMTQKMTVDPNDPNFQSAQEACAPEGGGGPGFSVGGPASGSDGGGTVTNGKMEDSQ